ncbi:MAG TPA: MFS transporter [Iamia sp.]|nr:MFS transporter [Iamia sp.]
MTELIDAAEPEATPAPGDGVWAPHRRRLTVGLVMTITLVAFESLAIATVMPTVEDDLGGRALYGWVFSGFFLASLAGIVVTGILTDRRGPMLPFAAGLALFSVGLVMGGLAPSMPILVAARVFQGFGAGAIPSSAYASVARGYPPAIRPRVFAIFSTAWVIPGITGPTIATFVEEAASWHWVFLGLLPLVAVAGLIAVPALGRLTHDHERDVVALGPAERRADRTRLARVAALIAGVGLVLAGGTIGHPLATAALVAVGLPVAVPAFLRLVPAGTARLRPGLPAIVAVRGLLTWAFFGVDAYVSLAATEGRGGSTRIAGAALSVCAVLWTCGSWSTERLLGRLGPRLLDRVGFLLIGLGSTGMLATALWLPAWAALPAWGVGGLGMGLAYSPLSVSMLGVAEPGKEGHATAALQLCDTLGVSLGTGTGGALIALADARDWARSTGVALAFALGIVIALAGLLTAGRLPTRVPGLEAT